MKIELNKSLDTGQLLDLENHLLEKFEEAYLTERPDLDQLAIRGGIDIQSEELGNELISFLGLNIPRVIIWKDGTKVTDKFGADNPFDLEADTPAKVVEAMLSESPIQPVGRIQSIGLGGRPGSGRDNQMQREVAELLKRTDLSPDDRQSLLIFQSMRFLTHLHRLRFNEIKKTYATA